MLILELIIINMRLIVNNLELLAIETPEREKQNKALNIIFFGNSYTMAVGSSEAVDLNGIPGIVQSIAEAAAYQVPNVQRTATGGKTLEWHCENSLQNIDNPSQLKESDDIVWDFVVLQDFSTRPLAVKELYEGDTDSGEPALTFKYGEEIVSNVREKSPNAQVVMYETWARHGSLENFYPAPFKNTSQFQNQLRSSYKMAADYIDMIQGEKISRVAPVGDAWSKLDFARDLYCDDRHHASAKGSLLNAMVIFRTIYGGKVSGLDLTELCATIKVSSEDCRIIKEIADSM